MVIDGLQLIVIAEARDDKGNSTKDSGEDRNLLVKKEKSSGASAAPIIVPIVLKMAEFDHKALLEEWISARSFSDNYPLQDKDKLISNLKTIQDYLCSLSFRFGELAGLTVSNISATTFPQTLDWLHSYLLQGTCQRILRTFLSQSRADTCKISTTARYPPLLEPMATIQRKPTTTVTLPQRRRIQVQRRRSSPATRSYHLALEGGSPSLGLGAPGFTFISKLLKESIYLTCKNPSNQTLP
ncbi:hypothetical protein AgCh_010067 [Apium graveolens]